jgi:hypothetical protein
MQDVPACDVFPADLNAAVDIHQIADDFTIDDQGFGYNSVHQQQSMNRLLKNFSGSNEMNKIRNQGVEING